MMLNYFIYDPGKKSTLMDNKQLNNSVNRILIPLKQLEKTMHLFEAVTCGMHQATHILERVRYYYIVLHYIILL